MTKVTVTTVQGGALAPCHPARARQLLRNGKARSTIKDGTFSVQLKNPSTSKVRKSETTGV